MAFAQTLNLTSPDDRELTPHSKRDPRTNPQPGDILGAGSEQREVVDVRDGRVEYGFPNRAATRWLSKFEWQRWARHADVVKVAA